MARIADPNAKITLLSAAEAVFAEKGVEAAKVEDITRRAGLSKGAFYLHFDTKEEALKQICETFLAHCAAAFLVPQEVPDLPTDPGELLAHCLDRDVGIFDLLWQNRSTVAILQSCQGPHLYLLQAFHERLQRTSQAWVAFWKRRAFFRADLHPEVTSNLLFGAYNQLAMMMMEATKKPPIEEWLRQAQAMLVRGFGTEALLQALEKSRARPQAHQNGGAAHKRRAR